jgi:hypothetical protein
MVDNVVNEWWRDRLHNVEQLVELAGEASGLGAEDLAGHEVRLDAWRWARQNRTGDGALPSGRSRASTAGTSGGATGKASQRARYLERQPDSLQ